MKMMRPFLRISSMYTLAPVAVETIFGNVLSLQKNSFSPRGWTIM